MSIAIAEGNPTPVGVTWTDEGWNFALFSRHVTGVTLLLYGAKNLVTPVFEQKLDPLQNKTGRIWHCFVPRIPAKYYAYRVEGCEKVLLDPFA